MILSVSVAYAALALAEAAFCCSCAFRYASREFRRTDAISLSRYDDISI